VKIKSRELRIAIWLAAAALLLRIPQTTLAQDEPIAVNPTDLARRADLVGKIVSVDDRIRFYQFHGGRGYDELYLKSTDVVFRLPPALRPRSQPRPMPVLVQGQLKVEEGQLVCDVSRLEVLPGDLDRLDRAIADLAATDFASRKAWAAWATQRGKAFRDSTLLQRARAIEAEALRLEAEQQRFTVDAPKQWLELAEKARRGNVAEPEPSALAHKALQAQLAAAASSESCQAVIATIERFFPQAAKRMAAGSRLPPRWVAAYASDPGGAYRIAPADIRAALDRRLWADATQKRLELQVAEDPPAAVALASEAETRVPDRPQLAPKLLSSAIDRARSNLGSLRLAELQAMAGLCRDKLQDPRRALDLCRDWLKIRKERLSPTDAEGPVALAALYEELLEDRAAARDLLARAWKIDPGNKVVAEAFRTLGYNLVKDQWVESQLATPDAYDRSGTVPATRPELVTSQGLKGKTPEEVSQLIASRPDRKVYSATKGQLIEQWIFVVSDRQSRFINFLRTPGEVQPRVIADYSLPRWAIHGELKADR
jgi:tetratricopeptide (TPR) repeat protein